MNNLATFYIVRHGETEWNVLHRIQGFSDSPLTDKGIQMAKDVATSFKDIGFDKAYSSDLPRAKRTAEIIAMEQEIEVETTRLLRERNYGKLEGESSDKYKELNEMLEALTDKERRVFKLDKEMESDEELASRAIQFIREVAVANPGKRILIVSHSATMRIMLIHLGYSSYKTSPSGAISNGGWIKLETDGVDFFIKETKGIKFYN